MEWYIWVVSILAVIVVILIGLTLAGKSVADILIGSWIKGNFGKRDGR